jgi:hypothetical protein
VQLPDGGQGFAVSCESRARCYNKAALACAPQKYKIVDERQRYNSIPDSAERTHMTLVCTY